MWFLKFFDLKDLRYVVLIALIGYGVKLYKDNQLLKSENNRVASNYKNALELDSLKVAVFKVTKENELQNLLDQNRELSGLVTQTKIKTKRIETIYYQQQKYLDSIKKKMDVTGLVSNIRKDIPAIAQWKDSTECLTITGNVQYKNDSLNINVNGREFNNNTVLIKSKGRRKSVKWLFGLRLGPREIKFTPESKCGTNKITIIEKVSK